MRVFLLFALFLGFSPSFEVGAAEPDAMAILKAIHLRERGKDVVWDLTIDLTDRSGDTRQRTGKIFRRTLDGGRSEQVTVFLSPANIRHTALLKVEAEDAADYMWLYLPALKVTKRVPPAERGDKFVGTDFTMEDVNLGFEYQDYNGTVLETKTEEGHPLALMRIEPKTAELKRDLGFDTSTAKVRTDQAIIVDQHFYKGDREIRHNEALDIRLINGVLTPMDLRSHDLVNDHRTVLKVQTATYNSGVPASYFGEEALAREMYH
ncbi:MAG: outer membrane lipoprotein-sorting protein [Methylococcaceae bacterium]|nr:outer membrane lipoprotein-sorting protein [Methylococcaceae bacterium]